VDGLALHRVKSDAVCPQKVALFLAQQGRLRQGSEKTESASEAKIHQAIYVRNLKERNLTKHLRNAVWSSAEGKNRWSYTFSPLVPLWCACGHLYVCISGFNNNFANNVLGWLIYSYILY